MQCFYNTYVNCHLSISSMWRNTIIGNGLISCHWQFMQGVINFYCWIHSVCMQIFLHWQMVKVILSVFITATVKSLGRLVFVDTVWQFSFHYVHNRIIPCLIHINTASVITVITNYCWCSVETYSQTVLSKWFQNVFHSKRITVFIHITNKVFSTPFTVLNLFSSLFVTEENVRPYVTVEPPLYIIGRVICV